MQPNQTQNKSDHPRALARKRALVLQTAFLGDVALSIPLLKRLRELDFEVTYICRRGLGDFLEATGLVSKAHEVQKGNSKSYKEVCAKLGQFDLALNVHESLRSSLLFRRIRAKQKIAFRTWANVVLGFATVRRNLGLPDPLRQLQVLGLADSDTFKLLEDCRGQDWARTDLGTEALQLLQRASMELPQFTRNPEKLFVLAPGSRWLTKRWTVEGYLAVAKEALQRGYKVCCVGNIDEQDICELLRKQEPRIENLAGKTSLKELLKLLGKAEVLICNDSGVMHLGSILGLPTVSIFGPTVLSQGYRPWNPQARVVEREQLSCRPCGKHGHMQCPIGTHECMKSVQPSEVLEALNHLSLGR